MTRDLARAVTRQSQSIHSFQGEDVSLGLWLAPLAPQYLKVSVITPREMANISVQRGTFSSIYPARTLNGNASV